MGPVSIAIHMCSVWVPFTSEGKEAVADYPEIVKEIKLALQEIGRRLKLYIGKRQRSDNAQKKVKRLSAYSKEMVPALIDLAEDVDKKKLEADLHDLLHNKFLTGILEGSAEDGAPDEDDTKEGEDDEEVEEDKEVDDNA